MQISDGRRIASEGEIDLASRSYKKKIFPKRNRRLKIVLEYKRVFFAHCAFHNYSLENILSVAIATALQEDGVTLTRVAVE